MKKKFLKILLIIILFILIIFLLLFIKEIYIIEKIKNKALELENSTNFYYREQRNFDRFGDSNNYIECRYGDTKVSQMGTMQYIIKRQRKQYT